MEQRSWLAVFVERWKIVALAVAVTAVVAIGMGLAAPEKHEVVTRFFVQADLPELAGSPHSPTAGDKGWSTLYAPIKSREVVQAGLDAAGVEVEDINEFIKADLVVVANAQAQTVMVSAIVEGDSEQALAFMEGLMTTLEETATAEFNDDLAKRLELSEAQLDSMWERVRVYPLPEGYTAPAFAGTDAYSALSRDIGQLEWAIEADKDLIVTLDQPTADKVSPSPLKDGAIGIALGLSAGLGVALVLDARDRHAA